MNTLDQTVHATSGSAAAVTRSTPSGTGITWPAGTTTFVGVRRRRPAGRTPASPTGQPVDARPDRGDGAAALHAEDVGGAGRRRVEALPLQQVGAVERRRRRRRARPRPDRARGRAARTTRQDLGASGLGGDDGAHAANPRRCGSGRRRASSALWSTTLSSGISSSTSSGSGASAGRSQPSASAWARAASASTCLGVGAAGRRPRSRAGTPSPARPGARRCGPPPRQVAGRSPSSTSASTSRTSHSSSIQSWRFTGPQFPNARPSRNP